jgi:signal transduction histidine kinase
MVMNPISLFFEDNIVVIYFLYGLAFFSMGLVVFIESRRTSTFRLADALIYLAAFGIIHGLHEWFEMFQRLWGLGAADIPPWLLLEELRLTHLVLSFVMLVMFGTRLIFATHEDVVRERILSWATIGALVGVWLLSVLATGWLYQPEYREFLTAVDVLSRYIIGIPGAVLAAWAIVLEQRTFHVHHLPETARDLLRAALALLLYGLLGQVFTKPTFLFPATVVNSELFVDWFGVPVQVFRMVMAIAIAFFVIRALRAFEVERQRNLVAANEARLDAQRKALRVQEQARLETDELNLELQTAVQDLTLLFDLSHLLATTLDKKELLRQAVNQITANLPRFARGIVVLRQKPGKPLDCAACAGHINCQVNQPCIQARTITRQIEETAVPVCMVGEALLVIPTTATHDSTLLEIDGDAAVGVPLRVQDRVIGSLVLHMSPEVTTLTVRDLSLLQTIAGQLGIALENAARYEESLAREALRGELLHQVVSAQEHERQRVARELHDSIGQALTGLGLGFAAVAETVKNNPTLAAAQVLELKQMSSQALADLRDLIRDLRPSLLDDLGLVPALHNQVHTFQTHTGVSAELVVHGHTRRLPPDLETIVFRIAQEALTNIAKHAQAKSVALTLEFTPEEIGLQVQDDGRGFAVDEVMEGSTGPRHAWGLLGMQERVSLVGGVCTIASTPGAGTAVQVRIPLNPIIEETTPLLSQVVPLSLNGN